MSTDINMQNKGYTVLHKPITSIHTPTAQGIDGVFEKNGEFYIVESKYSSSGTTSLRPGNEVTSLPKQMSKDWSERPEGLVNSVGLMKADEIMNTDYKRIVATITPDGNIKYNEVSVDGTIGDLWSP